MTKPQALGLPPGYAEWLVQLKSKITQARQRATFAVNAELVGLYRQIGREILTRQAEQGWGAKVIDRLAHDLKEAFPDMRGFSMVILVPETTRSFILIGSLASMRSGLK